MRILGVIFSSDMKWYAHIKSVLAKANKRIYIIRNLRRSDCPPYLILHAYIAFIRLLLLYGYPAFCNLPKLLQNDLRRVEKRVMRIIGSPNGAPPDLLSVADHSCVKLFNYTSTTPDHPLRAMFVLRELNATRNTTHLKPREPSQSAFLIFTSLRLLVSPHRITLCVVRRIKQMISDF